MQHSRCKNLRQHTENSIAIETSRRVYSGGKRTSNPEFVDHCSLRLVTVNTKSVTSVGITYIRVNPKLYLRRFLLVVSPLKIETEAARHFG